MRKIETLTGIYLLSLWKTMAKCKRKITAANIYYHSVYQVPNTAKVFVNHVSGWFCLHAVAISDILLV